jgi:two-component system, OmpR family, clock-associated histidine kinase SasA
LDLVLHSHKQCPDSDQGGAEELLLQLLLFVDQRSSSEEQVQEIKAYLQSLRSDYDFKLDVVEIEKQPHLVEFFRLVATPALVKMSPAPRQTLAGSNLIKQLEKWWPQWKGQDRVSLDIDDSEHTKNSQGTVIPSSSYDAQGIMLSDEIFSLRQEKAELEAQLRFKDQILAMLAHDLRTPLTAASMAVETIELSEKNDGLSVKKLIALKRKLFRQARNQFNIMDNMIGELLQNSQNNNVKLVVKPKPLNLCSLCQVIASQFDDKLAQKSMKFVLDMPQDLPLIYADPELIRQLISNLLDNAIKYTPEKGNISLSVLHRTNQKVQVSVCDTGPGIPLTKREQIFEDSFRLQRDRAEKGYGLGLATCHQIVSAHYGQIWVDSGPESGSCFRFTLLVYRTYLGSP